jgi:adenylosuccinate lyase
VTAHVSADELKACFEPHWYLRNVDAVFRRLGLA